MCVGLFFCRDLLVKTESMFPPQRKKCCRPGACWGIYKYPSWWQQDLMWGKASSRDVRVHYLNLIIHFIFYTSNQGHRLSTSHPTLAADQRHPPKWISEASVECYVNNYLLSAFPNDSIQFKAKMRPFKKTAHHLFNFCSAPRCCFDKLGTFRH